MLEILKRMTGLALGAMLALVQFPVWGQWAEIPVVPGDGKLTVLWQPQFDVEKVRMRISESADAWNEIPVTGGEENSYTIGGLENFRSFEIQLGSGGDQWSNAYHARPRGKQYPSGLHAGGQINSVVRAANGVMLIGGDVGCIHRSVDGGVTWYHSFNGIVSSPAGWRVSSMEYDPVSGEIYMFGGKTDVGYFYASEDNGISWNLRASGAILAVDGNTGNYPRPVGRLIAVDPGQPGHIYLAGYKGVRYSSNGGLTWNSLAFNGQEVRCLLLSGEYLYAAVRGIGVCRISKAGDVTVYDGPDAPLTPEELLILGGNLYAATHDEGILRLQGLESASADATWTDLEVGTTGRWSAIDGIILDGNHILYVGNSHGTTELAGGRHTTLMKCMNAQSDTEFNWINVSSAEDVDVSKIIAAGNGETYWRVDINKTENFYSAWELEKRLDGHVFAIDQIMVDPEDPDWVLVVGQMGLWRTLDAGSSWNPPVIGLGLAVHNCAAVNYSRPGHLYVGDTDNGLWVSHDYGESLAYITRPENPGVKPIIYDVFVDSLEECLYVAGKDNAWRYDLPYRSWSPVQDLKGNSLKEKTGGKIVKGVAAGTFNNEPYFIAAVQNGGIWCLKPDGSWIRPEEGPPVQEGGILGLPFCWPDNTTGLVYFFDGNSGLWRSRDAGVTWSRIWDKKNGARFSGSLAAIDPDTLFLATGDALYRLTGTSSFPGYGHPCSIMEIQNTGIADPGMVAAIGKKIFVSGASTASGTGNVVLSVSDNGGASFRSIPGDFYRGAAALPCRLAADHLRVYTVLNSMGTLISIQE